MKSCYVNKEKDMATTGLKWREDQILTVGEMPEANVTVFASQLHAQTSIASDRPVNKDEV